MWTRRRRWRHSLPLTAFILITAGLQVHWKKTWHWVPLKAALALEFNCPSLPRTWLNHCRWNWTATRSLGFTAEDWLATVSSLWASFSWCMKMSAMIAPGRACSLTNHCQGRIAGADCQLLKKKLIELITLHWTACWNWGSDYNCHGSLRLSMTSWSLMHCFEHCYVDWCTEVLEAGSLKIASLAHCTTLDEHCSVDYRLCLSLTCKHLDHCMHVQVCDTDSLNQCQGEVLRYMHCAHTTAHSTVLSSILTAWLKSLCKRADWVD